MHGLRYDVRLSDDGLYIIVELEGVINHASARRFTADMAKLMVKTSTYRVLVDARRARNGLSVRDKVLFVRPRRMAVNPSMKISLRVLLVDEADRSHDLVAEALRIKGHNVVISRDEIHAIGLLTGDG